ncbi:tryptophan 2,3-dioxygenase [Usitatibacter palustris]|uniref:Tryptophan 2,3-dioxygenase n=1 Tax=Usitatibacter palustris TaxID=2732487 RepID=A0A6M4HF28_9PROT|nr:tryptophan 2,3-dioxygenase [Usitatibacter palustris]QJR16647.1 Tryptophan 2,3-dioxygenase [Usitatibacter palustris]
MTQQNDPPADGARLDFAGEMSYGDYLRLDRILDAQSPRSGNHNELLFIVQHQATELWMKLMIHELKGARDAIRTGNLQPAFKMLARVARIMAQLNQSWDVLATLTPAEYSAFRGDLGSSSGFQSYQYRMVEFLLGNKSAVMLEPHRHRADLLAPLEQLHREPSLYDEAIRTLAARGFAIDREVAERDWTKSHEFNESVLAAWVKVYKTTHEHWDLYELAEKLVDLEDAFRQWRFRHATTVERVIGFKRGTGGTSGVGYLRRMVEVVLFPELWRARTSL